MRLVGTEWSHSLDCEHTPVFLFTVGTSRWTSYDVGQRCPVESFNNLPEITHYGIIYIFTPKANETSWQAICTSGQWVIIIVLLGLEKEKYFQRDALSKSCFPFFDAREDWVGVGEILLWFEEIWVKRECDCMILFFEVCSSTLCPVWVFGFQPFSTLPVLYLSLSLLRQKKKGLGGQALTHRGRLFVIRAPTDILVFPFVPSLCPATKERQRSTSC